MALRPGVVVPISADVSGLTRGITQAQSGLRRFGKIAAIAAGAAGIGAFVKTMQVGIEELRASQRVSAQTAAVLKSTGGAANVTAKQIESLSSALEKKSMLDDEAIQSGGNLLLTFTKIRNEAGKGNDIFNQTVQAMVDVSTAMGIDANTAAIQLGKALQDPIRGVGQLRRVGVSFTEAQRDQIKALVESGKTMEAQKMILRELEIQFGGSALAASKTLDGSLAILRNTFNNIAGDLVAKFLPSLTNAGIKLVNFLGQFGKQPTLEAKVRFVIDKFGDLIWSGAQTISNWWNKPKVQFEDNPANRLKVSIAPAGRDQANAFARDLADKLNASVDQFGFAVGQTLTRTIFGGARRGAAQQGEQTANSIVRSLVVNTAGLELGKRLVVAIFNGVRAELANVDFTAILNEWARSQIDIAGGIGFKLGKELIDGVADAAGKRRTGLSNVLTKQVKDAIQSARQSLAGAGASLGGSLAMILGASITGPKGMKPAEILAEERRIEDKRFEIEEARLKEAADATESTEEDKLALAEFYLNKEKTLRDRAIEEETAKRQGQINDLVEQFNQGLKSAKQFETELNAIVGADKGSALGIAFAGAFQREIDSIIKIAKEIQTVVGGGVDKQPIAGQGVGLVGTLSAENERRFQEALDAWQKRFDARKKIAEDARKKDGISAEERKEINEIMRDWQSKPGNKKPTRSQFGLTAMALGGILRQPTFVAGEAGKEAVIPLESGSAMRILRDAIGGGGGSTQNIYLTVHAGLGTNPDELSQVIVNSIKRYEKRNGAVFQGPLVTTAANATGRTDPTTGATTFNKIRTLRSG